MLLLLLFVSDVFFSVELFFLLLQQTSNVDAELKSKLTEYNTLKTDLSNYEKKQRSVFSVVAGYQHVLLLLENQH